MLLYNTADEVLAKLMLIIRIQTEDHEIELVNFADNTTIFLRDINILI